MYRVSLQLLDVEPDGAETVVLGIGFTGYDHLPVALEFYRILLDVGEHVQNIAGAHHDGAS